MQKASEKALESLLEASILLNKVNTIMENFTESDVWPMKKWVSSGDNSKITN